MQKKSKKLFKFFNLEKYRKQYGLTQREMAALLGMCESNYNHKINRVTSFTYEEMLIIKDELNKRAKKSGNLELTLDDIFLG